jgi:hypothetical protein
MARLFRIRRLLVPAIVLGGLVPVAGAAAAAPVAAPAPGAVGAGLPVVTPTPRSMVAVGDGFALTGGARVVGGSGVEASALAAATSALGRAGTNRAGTNSARAGSGDVAVYVGGPGRNPASARALGAMGVRGPEGLPPGGYVLAVGRANDVNTVVLAGVDAAGDFYAAQTLRQIVRTDGASARLPGMVIVDFPAFGLRGGMESFYGNAWPQADLLRHLDFLGQHKMNAFQYIVSGDPYTVGALWRQQYPPADLARFAEAIQRAQANQVDFIYRINPEAQLAPAQGICHALTSDLQALVNRFQQLWNVGERTFALGWDDVGGQFVCTLDQQTFGGAPSPLAAAQAHVVNYVYNNFVLTHPGAKLVTVPTEYWGNAASTYRTQFTNAIPAAVPMFWTGPAVVSPTITATDLAQAQQAFAGRPLLIFDNYPVNDYAPRAQHLAPLVGRDPALAGSALGFFANEMQQAEASLLSLFTVAEYAWNPSAYDAQASWTRSLQEFGGAAYPALRAYAEHLQISPLHPNAVPPVRNLIITFRQAYRSGASLTAPGDALLAELARIRQAPAQLRSTLGNASFVQASEPWFAAVEHRAAAAEHAVTAIRAQVAGDMATYRSARRSMGLALNASNLADRPIAPGVYEDLFELANSPRSASVMVSDNRALSVFARGTNGQLQTSWQTAEGTAWQPFTALPGVSMSGAPDVLTMRNGAQVVFVRGSDNKLWHNWQNSAGSAWHGWVSLGGTVGDSPEVVMDDTGVLVAFMRGTDGQLWHVWQTSPGGTWSGFVPLSGVSMVGKPDVVVARNGAKAVFVRGTDNRIWHNWQTSPGGTWNGWISLGGSAASHPHAVLANDGTMSVYIRGTDGRFFTAWQSFEGSAFSAFTALPGVTMRGEPDIQLGTDGRLTAFVRGTDNRVWTNWQTAVGAGWNGWVAIGGSGTGSPRGIASPKGNLSVYAVGPGNAMHTSWQSSAGSAWSGWVSLGGSLTID